MIKKRTNIFANFYLIAIILYISQGILFEGTWFTFLSGIYLLGTNMYCLLRSFASKDKGIFRLIFCFVLWVLLLWIISPKSYRFHLMSMTVPTVYMVQYTIIVCTSVFSFYFFTTNKCIEIYKLKLFALSIGLIYIYNILNYDVYDNGVGTYDFSIVNNKSYSLVALFPVLSVFWNKKLLMILLMTASLFLVVFCLKRGAIIIVTILYVSSIYYVYLQEKGRGLKGRLLLFVLFLLVLSIVTTLYWVYNSNDFLQDRIEETLEGSSSGRDIIYMQIWDAWLNSDFLLMMIGHGPISTLSASINYAHNDWLEILYDFGIIGLVLYIGICMRIFVFFRKSNLTELQKVGSLLCLFYIVLRSTFSMCIYELDSMLAFGFLGYLMGENTMSGEKHVGNIHYQKKR